jgi:hypothetical protein
MVTTRIKLHCCWQARALRSPLGDQEVECPVRDVQLTAGDRR